MRPKYHHGDLREALLVAAEAVLARDGVDHFTLRACAREAGVSHAAPAHHFGDLNGIIAALAARGFDRLSALMDRYAAEAGTDPRAILPVMGVAYIDFALRNPGLYRLMARVDVVNRTADELRNAAFACHSKLNDAVRSALDPEGRKPPTSEEVNEVAALAWSVVHGYAALALDGQFGPGTPAERPVDQTLVEYAVKILMRLQPVFASRDSAG